MPGLNEPEAYGAATAQRVKMKLDALDVSKEGGAKNEGVHYF